MSSVVQRDGCVCVNFQSQRAQSPGAGPCLATALLVPVTLLSVSPAPPTSLGCTRPFLTWLGPSSRGSVLAAPPPQWVQPQGREDCGRCASSDCPRDAGVACPRCTGPWSLDSCSAAGTASAATLRSRSNVSHRFHVLSLPHLLDY